MSIFGATAAFNDEGDLALAKASAIVASVLALVHAAQRAGGGCCGT